jgi:hypothetical protein
MNYVLDLPMQTGEQYESVACAEHVPRLQHFVIGTDQDNVSTGCSDRLSLERGQAYGIYEQW